MSFILRKFDQCSIITGIFAAILIFPLIGSMLWEVIARYLFSKPTIWAYEAAYMQMGAIFTLGIAYVTKHDAHVRVDLFYANFSARLKACVNIFGNILAAPLILWLCFGLWEYFYDAFESGERSGESLWNPYVWPARFIFWIGFLILAIETVSQFIKNVLFLLTDINENGVN